ncbi:MAG: DUF5808 domain-containing protein [Verrucomicrobiota bacterium]
MNTKYPHGTLNKLWRDPHHWKWGGIYVCSEDPRWIVPKRQMWRGWTINFGHPKGWIGFILFTIVIISPTLYLTSLGLADTKYWYITILSTLLMTCIFCAFCASTKRYEE